MGILKLKIPMLVLDLLSPAKFNDTIWKVCPSRFTQLEISVEVNTAIKDEESSSSITISRISETMLRSHRGRCCFNFSRKRFSQIAPVAWMILFGDSFHNLSDGMTIAVGFTESPTIGIALTLSILFEELPHELG